MSVLLSERTLLMVCNYFDGKSYRPKSEATPVNSVPSGRISSKKIADVNGHQCDKHPQSLNVPECKESKFVVSDKVESIVLSNLHNIMQFAENKMNMEFQPT
jgi:hypothetical protein